MCDLHQAWSGLNEALPLDREGIVARSRREQPSIIKIARENRARRAP
jgi:hypothetical protein